MLVSKQQIWLTLLAGLFLFAAVCIFALFAFTPDANLINGPLLLTGFIVALLIGTVCLAVLLRGLLQPYNQLIGEAKRAPVAHSGKVQNEAAFVLETFQTVVAQLQDQQKELERLSHQATQRANSAEQFSERIVASMPTGLVAFDAAGHATVINGPARTLFTDGANATGDHFRTLFADLPALVDMIELCLLEGRVFRREELYKANGTAEPKRIGATIAPIERSEAGSRGALCMLTDITEVTRLREQVALKRNLESLGEMSAGLAHEFKNAMAALHGYAQFLESVDHDERGKAAASALVHEVRMLSEMINSFLNFARPQPLQLEKVSPDDLIQECVVELRPLFDARRVGCAVVTASGKAVDVTRQAGTAETAGSSSTPIQADPRMLRQALLNLLRNAAEAIPDGQNDRRVTVTLSEEVNADGRRSTVVEIRDTGSGIPTPDLQKIFIPFFTTKSTGHGVGLALAHRVITEHGGTLTAANAADGGALFTLRLRR